MSSIQILVEVKIHVVEPHFEVDMETRMVKSKFFKEY
jgi:hypothetical protein